MQREYLVGYVIQKGNDLGGFGDMMGIGSTKETRFGSQKIRTIKIDLPNIYKIISKKENISISSVIILGVSLLD